MNAIETGTRRLVCQPMTAEAFSPFGVLIDPQAVSPELINDGTTRRYSDLAQLDLNTDTARPRISMYVADARVFPLPILKLERHRQSAQAFLPLGMQRFIVVVSGGGATPDCVSLTAFITAPGQGVSLHRGTWHHGLIALNHGDRFAVIEGGNYRTDTEEVRLLASAVLVAPARLDGN